MSLGRCLCGAIELSTHGAPIFVAHCHCQSCRRQSGSIPATFVGFNSPQVTVTKGEVTEHNSSPHVYRGFCGTCGSAIHYRQSEWNETHLYIGVFDDPAQFKAGNHVFYNEAVRGYEMHDNLARFGAEGNQPLAWGPLPTTNALFLCSGNSARSIIAEAIFNRYARGGLRAFSAGSKPSATVNPGAIEELAKRGYRTDHLHSKSWDTFSAGDEMRWVITLCDDAANDTCPVFPGECTRDHWGLPDPAAGAVSFAATYDDLESRIKAFLSNHAAA